MRTYEETKALVVEIREYLKNLDTKKLPETCILNDYTKLYEPAEYVKMIQAQLEDSNNWKTFVYQCWLDDAVAFVKYCKKTLDEKNS